jgi:hypothetical protein
LKDEDDDRKWDPATIEIIWHGVRPIEVDEVVRKDLACKTLYGLEDPEELIFHTVFLGRSMDNGPTVTVWGDPDDPGKFHAEYSHKTEWTTMGEIEAEPILRLVKSDTPEIKDVKIPTHKSKERMEVRAGEGDGKPMVVHEADDKKDVDISPETEVD